MQTAGPGTRTPGETTTYSKETWPQELTRRPITYPRGMAEIQGELEVNLSENYLGEPVVFTPDAYYGVNDRLSVGLIDTDLCLTGQDGGCSHFLNSTRVDTIYAFMTNGPLNLGAHGGIAFLSFDPLEISLKAGVLGKYMSGKLAVVFDPHLAIGVTRRDVGNKEFIDIPVEVQYQATPKLAVVLETAITGPFEHFGDFVEIPVGAGGLYNINNKLDVGGTFTFTNILGANYVYVPGEPGAEAGALDGRALEIFVNFRI